MPGRSAESAKDIEGQARRAGASAGRELIDTFASPHAAEAELGIP
jgi:hypothetical protein